MSDAPQDNNARPAPSNVPKLTDEEITKMASRGPPRRLSSRAPPPAAAPTPPAPAPAPAQPAPAATPAPPTAPTPAPSAPAAPAAPAAAPAAAQPPPAPRAPRCDGTPDKGRFLDAYELKEELGAGGFAKVHRCIEKESGAVRAVKVMDKNTCKPSALADMQREAKVMGQIEHPNVVTLYKYYEDANTVHMVMDLVDGGELFYKIVELSNYSELTASRLMKNLLGIVAHLHEHKIAHRDLKPENLLLMQKERSADAPEDCDAHLTRIKLVDFGFAKFFEPGKNSFTEGCGTLAFMAPEVIKTGLWKKQEGYDEKCDVWSMGVICFILLSGCFPFRGKNNHELVKNVVAEKWNLKAHCWEEISQEAKDFVRLLMTGPPEKRPSAAEALKHPWIAQCEDLAKKDAHFCAHLSETVRDLNEFNASRKLKGTVRAFQAAQRFINLLKRGVEGNADTYEAEEADAAALIQKRWRRNHSHRTQSSGPSQSQKETQAAPMEEDAEEKKPEGEEPAAPDAKNEEAEEESEADPQDFMPALRRQTVASLKKIFEERNLEVPKGKKEVLVEALAADYAKNGPPQDDDDDDEPARKKSKK